MSLKTAGSPETLQDVFNQFELTVSHTPVPNGIVHFCAAVKSNVGGGRMARGRDRVSCHFRNLGTAIMELGRSSAVPLRDLAL